MKSLKKSLIAACAALAVPFATASMAHADNDVMPEPTKLLSSLSSSSSFGGGGGNITPPSLNTPKLPSINPGNPGNSGNSTITIDQGDQIVIDGIHKCTIGYVDKVKGVAYTAQHCGGYTFKQGKPVRMLENGRLTTVGTFDYPHSHLKHIQFPSKSEYDTQFGDNPGGYYIDIAAIKLNSNARLGSNTYSNNAYTKYEDITVGQSACFYGVTTRNAKCGKVVEKLPNTRHFLVQLNDNSEPLPGDSGGPIYAPNKGNSLGILSGVINDDDGANYIDVTGL